MWRLLLRVFPVILFSFALMHPAAQAQVTVTLPDLQVSAGASELIPITVGDLSGSEVKSFELSITYDPTIVEITGVSNEGTLTSSVAPIVNTTTSGKVTIAWADAFALQGSGILVYLEASFLQEGTSTLAFDSFRFNEGAPAAATTNGVVTVGSGSTGSVNVSLPGSSSGTVGGSQLTIPVSVNDVTGKNVTSYSFTLLYDAAVIDVADYTVGGTLSSGSIPSVTTAPGQLTVTWSNGTALSGAGVLGNLRVNPVAGGISTLTISTIQFNSGDPTATVTNGSVTINAVNDPVSVSLPELSGQSGENISIPITVGSLTGKSVTSFSATIDYDESLMQISGVSQSGTLTSGSNASVDLNTPGKISITWSGATLSGTGTLLNLSATLLSAGTSPLTMEAFTFNGGTPEATTDNGSVSIIGADVLAVSIPGNLIGEIGDQITIPINTGDITGSNVISYVFTLVYNADDLSITGANASGTLSAGGVLSVNTDTPGQVIVSLAAATPLSGSGTLVNLNATLEGPGTSDLSFSSFQYNNGTPAVATVDGSVTVQGFATYLQIVHNSSDAPSVDIYLNDVRAIDNLVYGNATAFLELTEPNVKLDVVRGDAGDNSSPITSSNVAMSSDQDYVAVLNGLYTGSGKQAIGLVIQESQQESTDGNSIGLNVFQGSPDAPLINAYIVDDSDSYNRILTLAKGLGFGDAFLTKEFEPGLYNVELTQNSGERIGIYRADLSRTGGAALLFMVQGFVNPIIGQPDLSITAYAPDGTAIFLPLATDNEDEFELPQAFEVAGNYPNPFNPTTTIEFNLPEPAQVTIEVFDMLGREVMSTQNQMYQAGTKHAFEIDASRLSSGTYVYRVVAQGQQQTYTQSNTMTLLK